MHKDIQNKRKRLFKILTVWNNSECRLQIFFFVGKEAKITREFLVADGVVYICV